MLNSQRGLMAAAVALFSLQAGGALAGTSPVGVWIDHSGEGAVEISDCGGKLCGNVVWLKTAANQETCNTQVIGDVKSMAGGRWDGGWIYDPESKEKYDVEITPMTGDKLKILGYAKVKWLGETFTWTRAPADLKRCDGAKPAVEEAKAAPAVPAPAAAVEASKPAAAGDNKQTATAQPAPVPAAPATESTPPVASNESAPATAGEPANPERQASVRPKKARGELFDFEEIKLKRVKGQCDLNIKELGSFKFDC